MNKENVQHAINIMERAKDANGKFSMTRWQSTDCKRDDGLHALAVTEAELHACGNSACFAGYVAVSPEWAEAGGTLAALDTGIPKLYGEEGSMAIAKWLSIEEKDASSLCCTRWLIGNIDRYTLYGGKNFEHITIDDVLVVLYRLLNTGSIWENKHP